MQKALAGIFIATGIGGLLLFAAAWVETLRGLARGRDGQ